MCACLKRLGPVLYGTETVSLSLNVSLLNAEVIETLLHRYVMWTLSSEQPAGLLPLHHQVLLRVVGFLRRQHIDFTTLWYPKALKNREQRHDQP